jgi:predicted dehydrogenase
MKPIPIAIVGLNFGRHIADQLQHPSLRKLFRIAAVCDLDRAKAEAKARELGARAYHDLDALLADASIPAIGLFTGPANRAVLLRKILRAGKDVMTTKPFEVDPKAAAAVLREGARRGRVVHLNSPAPFHSPDLAQIARWREQYDLGRPVGARADTWGTYQETADGSWYDDPLRCPVAPIFRLGIYLVNDLIALYGPVESVQVLHSRIRTGRPTPDNAQLALRFKNGALANIYCSFCIDDTQSYRNTLTLNFERGTIYRNPPQSPRTPEGRDGCDLLLVTSKGKRAIVRRKAGLEMSGTYQWRAFHRALSDAKGAPAPTTLPRQIVDGIQVIVAMSRAERSQRIEKV